MAPRFTIRLVFEPMLARAGDLPRGDYACEVKWDGFRSIVSTEDGLRVWSPRR
jgi:ATP-dependent DNA ligase